MARIALSGPRNRIYSTWKFMRDPYTTLEQWQAKYGATYLVPALNGDVVITGQPENARRIFAAPSDAVGQFALATVKPLIGESSLLAVEGEQHRRDRSRMLANFDRERVASQAQTVHDVAQRVAKNWEIGQTIRVMDAALDVSMEVIVRVVFGVQSPDRVELYKRQMKAYVASFHPALAFSKKLQRPLFGLSPWNRFVRERNAFYELVQQELDQRRAVPSSGKDLLSHLLTVGEQQDETPVDDSWIRDQLITMLFAGHETTQIAIAWAMSWLHRHPLILTRLQKELHSLDSFEAILNSQLLEGVCYESLRLNPIVADVIRIVKKPMELVDVQLPAGAAVSVAIYSIHRNAGLYPKPEAFEPDRWEKRTYRPYEFLPFGGGIRRCLGASLALLEMKIVIATWIKHYQFSLPANALQSEPVYRRNITIAPKSGIPLEFQGWRAA